MENEGVVAILLIGALGVGGYFLWKHYQSQAAAVSARFRSRQFAHLGAAAVSENGRRRVAPDFYENLLPIR